MNILYFTSLKQDYLSDSILIGLKGIDGVNIYEYPGNNFIYYKDNLSKDYIINNYYGRGFTLYNKIDSSIQLITDEKGIFTKKFDFVIFSVIYSQYDLYKIYAKYFNNNQIIILDGDDSPALFPFNGKFMKWYNFFNFEILHKKHLYFKRELTIETLYYRFYKLLPKIFLSLKYLSKNIFPISFSIPENLIVNDYFKFKKTKLFTNHIVDPEISLKVNNTQVKYVFTNEDDYFNDIKISKFGITTKKGGWDCLRHYEIAANGGLICFKNLNFKHHLCAPHDLIHNINCLNYENYEDLILQINSLSAEKFNFIVNNSIEWAKNKSSINISKHFLETIIKNKLK